MVQQQEILGYKVPSLDSTITQYQSIVIVGNATGRIISFPDEFNSHAVNLVIDNRDGLNSLLYRLNSNITQPKTIGPGETETISDSKTVYLQLLAGGSNNWEIQAQVYPIVHPKSHIRSVL